MTRLVRGFVLTVASAAAVFLVQATQARADVMEFCPAHLNGFHAFASPHDGLISFYVAAESARTVSANVIVQSDRGWYTFQVKNANLVADVAHYESPTVRFDRTLYHTKPLYVQLPAGEGVVRWWIYDATAVGDATFGWDKRGDVTCFPQPEGETKFPPLANAPKRVNESYDLAELPGPSDSVLVVSPIPQPAEMTECAKPFVPASVVHATQPTWPSTVRSLLTNLTTEVEIAVNSDGSLAGAWVYTPSGIADLDLAALRAAEASTYRGGIALCKPAPGNYLFRADFDPN